MLLTDRRATIDFLPTVLTVASEPQPTRKIDGLNFLPVLTGQIWKGPREVLYYHFDGNCLEAGAAP